MQILTDAGADLTPAQTEGLAYQTRAADIHFGRKNLSQRR